MFSVPRDSHVRTCVRATTARYISSSMKNARSPEESDLPSPGTRSSFACEIDVSLRPEEFAGHPYLSPPILRLFIYLSFFVRAVRRAIPSSLLAKHSRIERFLSPSPQQFAKLQNAQGYEYATRSRRRRGRRRRRGGGRGKDYRRGMVGVMVQTGGTGDSPRSGYFMESRGRVHTHVFVL